MAAPAPRFAKYVSSVEGRLASPPGSPHSYIGAKIPTPEDRKAGQNEITWQTDVVVPVLEADYIAHVREWDALIRDGDVKERTEQDFAAYTKKLEGIEAEHVKKLEAEAAEAAKKADEAKKAEEAETKRKADEVEAKKKAEADAAEAKRKAEADAKKAAASKPGTEQ